MFRSVNHVRGYVYPRLRRIDSLRASDVILGMLVVMLAMLAVACAITFAAAR